MRVLVVGGGGREHALCWKLAASPLLDALFCAPGNPGIAEVATCVPIAALDLAGLVGFAREQRVDLVVVGPEAPLVAGLADACAAAGIACCGPSAAAARLEGSKRFMKEVATTAGIPTAAYASFDGAEAARTWLDRHGAPVVVKADGLAAGKGVVVAETMQEAAAAIDALLGLNGTVLLEERLQGPEVSLFALCDGTRAVDLGSATDYKRVGEGDVGPNTGGMGAVSPAPLLTPALRAVAFETIVAPALAELARRGAPFRGILFAGLMLTADGPKLLEFNVRFGDPECQALLPRIDGDLLPALHAAALGDLSGYAPAWREAVSVAVVMASRGYPGPLDAGGPIRGLQAARSVPDMQVFHAGTERRADGTIGPAGGRVLTLVGTGPDVVRARAVAYAGVAAIDWPEGFCRRDIGAA